jgi:hypothetical protein
MSARPPTASLEIACLRRAKVALIEAIAAFGAENPHWALDPMAEASACDLNDPRNRSVKVLGIAAPDMAAPELRPPQQIKPNAEALLRALPELMKLDRYERRAASRRMRALHLLTS